LTPQDIIFLQESLIKKLEEQVEVYKQTCKVLEDTIDSRDKHIEELRKLLDRVLSRPKF